MAAVMAALAAVILICAWRLMFCSWTLPLTSLTVETAGGGKGTAEAPGSGGREFQKSVSSTTTNLLVLSGMVNHCFYV